MIRMRWTTPIAFAAAALLCMQFACSSSEEKKMRANLAGRWVWRQERPATKTTVEVLDLTGGGRYTVTTYREIRGQRKLLYFHSFTKDLVEEPESEDAIAKLKADGYNPAVEKGAYDLDIGESIQQITFESSTLSQTSVSEGMSARKRPMTYLPPDKLIVGGKAYAREAAAPPTP
jgi:hypothetical protein